MRHWIVVSAALALLWCLMSATTRAQGTQTNTQNDQADSNFVPPGITSSNLDPVVLLHQIRQKRKPADTPTYSLFRTSPLTPIRERAIAAEKRIYERTNIKFGSNLNTLSQGLTDNIDGTDDYGMASFLQAVATWDGFNKGESNQGELTIALGGRWNWGTTDPVALGVAGLGASGFTANPFNTYTPTFIIRNLFWRQGSREAGWMYRIGHVTPDQFFGTSAHITPLTTFTPIIHTGPFAMALPDSGLGMFGGLFVNDRVNIAGALTDANANRFNWGDPKEGDIFTAVELQAKIFPVTEKAGYSKATFWYNEGTDDGLPANGSTGLEGWGFFLKFEQELSCDGRFIGITRYGKSYDDSALYGQQAGGHLVLYDPFNSGSYKDSGFNADLAGISYSWIQPTGLDRDESNLELFYRFPLFPEMDATVSYQGIFNPAQDPTNDYGSAISLRLRSTW
jgi:porin